MIISTVCRGIRIGVIVVFMSLISSACALGGGVIAKISFTLVGNIAIITVRNQGIKMAVRNGVNRRVATVVGENIASIVGTFLFDQISSSLFEDEAPFIVIHHIVGDEPVSTVIKIEDTGNLGVKIKSEADVYPFEDGRIVIDALPMKRQRSQSLTEIRDPRSLRGASPLCPQLVRPLIWRVEIFSIFETPHT